MCVHVVFPASHPLFGRPHTTCWLYILNIAEWALHGAVTSHQNKKAEIPVWVRALARAVKLVFLLGCLHLIYIVFNTKLASSEGIGTLVKSMPLGLRLLRHLSEWRNLSQMDCAAHRVMECSSEHCSGCFAVTVRKRPASHRKARYDYQTAPVLKCFQWTFKSKVHGGFLQKDREAFVIAQKQSYIHDRGLCF